MENVSKDIILHGNWPYRGVGVGEQYANVYRQTSALQCESNSEGMASQGFGDFGLDRFHIRLWLTWQSGGKPKTVGTPHWERVVRCGTFSVGHAVLGYGTIPGSPGESGFEAAKHKLKQNFRDSGHKVGALQWGNDLAVEQCNGWIAANGDGYVALVYTNHLIP